LARLNLNDGIQMALREINKYPYITEVLNERYDCTYLIKDYGDYKTISKIILRDGKRKEVIDKINEYVFWRAPFSGKKTK
jgi:hypothetical protein